MFDLDQCLAAFYSIQPDVNQASQRVAFGTSGHRGSSLAATFNEAHIVVIAKAVADYRQQQGIDGPLFLGRDTHALSQPAWEV